WSGTVFCQSPSVIPPHTPGTYGPSRTTHLCVPLVGHSASYFAGAAGSPHMALGCLHTPVPRRPDQQLDALWTRGRQQIVDIGFPITDADKAGLGTPVLSFTHRRQTGEPFLTFLLADGKWLAPGALAHVGRVT